MSELSLLTPALALICWTLVMWVWMYATRIPAMQKQKIDAGTLKTASDLEVLPMSVRQIAENYNHLHEQPVIFYALAVYAHMQGLVNEVTVMAAWAYVVLRIIHSVFQATVNFVPVRFVIFVLSSLCLFLIAGIQVGALFA